MADFYTQFGPFSVLSRMLRAVFFNPSDVVSRQHQDREGEEGACEAAWDDKDGNQWGGNRWRDGEGEEVLPAADVRGQPHYDDNDDDCESDLSVGHSRQYAQLWCLTPNRNFTKKVVNFPLKRWKKSALDWETFLAVFLFDPFCIQCVDSISSKSTRSRSRKGWTCCRTSSSISTRSASKTGSFFWI